MPGDHRDRTTAAVARNFFCEHSVSKSRVLALVSTARNESLRAVLTCTDRLLAERAAALLSQAANGGPGPNMNTETERVAAALPDAPAASFRHALQHVYDGTWPIDNAESLPTYEQVHDSYGYDLTEDQSVTPWLRDSSTRTPSDARLEHLTGPVLRIITMLELHVYDPRRLLTAATAAGWTSPSDEDSEADELDDLLDAAMFLAGSDVTIPGLDIITEESSGEHLETSRGDQLSDWADHPVEAIFGTGWRRRQAQDASAENAAHHPAGEQSMSPGQRTVDDLPGTHSPAPGDTAAIRASLAAVADRVRHPNLRLIDFISADADVDDTVEDDSGIPDTEREPARLRRAALAMAATEIIERCVTDLQIVEFDENGQVADSDSADDSFVYATFPHRFRASYDEQFFRKVLVTAVKVAYDLADPDGGEATCTAEEIVRQAVGELAMFWWDISDLGEALLHPDEVLLEDTDFEFLFDEQYDGLENDPAQQAGMGVFVARPQDWFAPFNDDRIVHPYTETNPSTDLQLPDLYSLLPDGSQSIRDLLPSAGVDAPSPLSSLAPASEVIAITRRGSDHTDPDLWIADESDPEASFAKLVAAASRDSGSGWMTWEPYHDADTVRTEPVVHFVPHRHFPHGNDQPWAEVAIGGGRIIAVPLHHVVSYRPDPDVRRRWNLTHSDSLPGFSI